MRNLKSVVFAGLCFLLAVSSSVPAEETPIQGQLGCKLCSAYAWRGRVINEDAVFQPEVLIAKEPFTLDVWGTWDWEGDRDSSQRSRIDASLDYSFSWNQLFFKVGGVGYVYHDGPPDRSMKDTLEIYFETMWDVLLNPSVIVYYDMFAINGTYAALSAGDGFGLGYGIDLQMRGRLGFGSAAFNKGFFKPDAVAAGQEADFSPGGDLVDLSGTIKCIIPAGERLTIVPAYEYVTLVSSDLRDVVRTADRETEANVFSCAMNWLF